MTQQRYGVQSRELLRKAFKALSEEDLVQASEKGWGAAAQIVKAVAETRGWTHNGHRQLFETLRRIVEESMSGKLSSIRIEPPNSKMTLRKMEPET